MGDKNGEKQLEDQRGHYSLSVQSSGAGYNIDAEAPTKEEVVAMVEWARRTISEEE